MAALDWPPLSGHSGFAANRTDAEYPWRPAPRRVRTSTGQMAGIALEGANIPAVVVGIGIGMKGGALLVPEDRVDAALKVLKDLEERR
jgi:hypothetical protein